MLYVESQSLGAAFHFAAEEFLMRRVTANDVIFMTWRTGKCAMIGRNQITHAEIDVRMAEETGVQIVRRPSGGGTIFTDPGTLLYTMILPLPYHGERDVKRLESEYVSGPAASALNKMGLCAKVEGRNDILVNGAKISGIAQYVKDNRLCTHGSLLFDANLDALSAILKPDEEKIRSKALRSVRKRVTNILPFLPEIGDIHEFRRAFVTNIIEGRDAAEYILTASDIAAIELIKREKYDNPEWTFGHAPKFSFHNAKRFPAGRVEIFLDVAEGIIKSCEIKGDFLGVSPINGLEKILESKLYRHEEITRELAGTDIVSYLGGVTKEQFIECVFPEE